MILRIGYTRHGFFFIYLAYTEVPYKLRCMNPFFVWLNNDTVTLGKRNCNSSWQILSPIVLLFEDNLRLDRLFSACLHMLQYPLNTFPINETEWNKNMYLLSINTKADPGTARRVPPSLFWKKETCFCKFSLYIRRYFDFSQHAVLTICILFTNLLTKT